MGRGQLREQIAELEPGYAALVMATGIVSTALVLFAWNVLSAVLYGITVVAAVVLLLAYSWRLIAYRHRVLVDAQDPSKSFGFFTVVAAADVLGMRAAVDHHRLVIEVLGIASVPVWLVLTYAIPGALIVGHRNEAVLPKANGSWFMWVVATQSLAASAATIAASDHRTRDALAPVAVALWGIGVVLYLMLAGLLVIALLEEPVAHHALSPTYWVYMGATAITVLAGARILALPSVLPVVAATHQVVSGLAFLLWAFGTWWVPLLAGFGVRRLLVRSEPVRYDPTMWSIVFPLGMYAVASVSYGQVTHLDFMVDIARVAMWISLAAWLALVALMVSSTTRRGRSLR